MIPNIIYEDKPVIVFDVDAVLLDWMARLQLFLKEKGLPFEHVSYHVKNPGAGMVPPEAIFLVDGVNESLSLMREYNSSEHMAKLPVFEPGAPDVVSKLSEKFELYAVTNMGNDTECSINRHKNLELRYPGCISKIFCLDFKESKYDILKKIASTRNVVAFIDDTAYKVKDGLRAGISSYQLGYENGDVDGTLPRIWSLKALLPLLDGKAIDAEIPLEGMVANA